MRPLIAMWKKEFQQMFHDPAMLRILLIVPIIQLLILSYSINTELKQMRVIVLDYDHSISSKKLTENIFASSYFVPVEFPVSSFSQAEQYILQSKAEMILTIPQHYEKQMMSGAVIQAVIDGQNSNVASIGLGYLQRMIYQQNQEILSEQIYEGKKVDVSTWQIEPIIRIWYNQENDSKLFFVPGISILLITITATLLSGIAIVKEREIGTIELLLVAPIRKWHIIAGKIIPFYFLSLVLLTFALAVGMSWFRVPFLGSPFTLWAGVTLYLFFLLSLGLFISTVSKTQSQAMFLVWFLLIFSIMMSGFFFPIENMPNWLQKLTLLNPMRYVISIIRCVLLKGSTISQLSTEFISLLVLGGMAFTSAVLRYRQKLV